VPWQSRIRFTQASGFELTKLFIFSRLVATLFIGVVATAICALESTSLRQAHIAPVHVCGQ
jgi:hypothetical protein